MTAYKSELKGVSIGKGCIGFTNPEKIEFEVVKKKVLKQGHNTYQKTPI